MIPSGTLLKKKLIYWIQRLVSITTNQRGSIGESDLKKTIKKLYIRQEHLQDRSIYYSACAKCLIGDYIHRVFCSSGTYISIHASKSFINEKISIQFKELQNTLHALGFPEDELSKIDKKRKEENFF